MTIVKLKTVKLKKQAKAVITALKPIAEGTQGIESDQLHAFCRACSALLKECGGNIKFDSCKCVQASKGLCYKRKVVCEIIDILCFYVLREDMRAVVERHYVVNTQLPLSTQLHDTFLAKLPEGVRKSFGQYGITTYETLLAVEITGRRLPWWHYSLAERLKTLPGIHEVNAKKIIRLLEEMGIKECLQPKA